MTGGAAGRGDGAYAIACFSSQDWSTDLPTNRQHIMRRVAARGHPVLFVETGGFLGIHLLRLLLGPGRASLARRLFGVEPAAPGVRVRKALNVLPLGQKYHLASRVNARLTGMLVGLLLRRLGTSVAWIYDPRFAEAAGVDGRLVVYDCVDDYPQQAAAGRRRKLIARADRRAAQTAELVFATTEPLFERLRRLNAATHLVPNVGDYDHFAPAADRALAGPDATGLPRPVLGFTGNFVRSKVDFRLIEALAGSRPEWTFLLVGPVEEAEAAAAMRRIRALTNVRWVGPKRYDELPRYVSAFDVGLIPYAPNEYTQSCFPLKLYEYLAAGKPVVASGLPALAGMEPDVVVADGVDAFATAVERALERQGPEDRGRRMALAARNTWETRTERMLALVGERLAAGR